VDWKLFHFQSTLLSSVVHEFCFCNDNHIKFSVHCNNSNIVTKKKTTRRKKNFNAGNQSTVYVLFSTGKFKKLTGCNIIYFLVNPLEKKMKKKVIITSHFFLLAISRSGVLVYCIRENRWVTWGLLSAFANIDESHVG
jgi:uncharacterized membrane protein YfcA